MHLNEYIKNLVRENVNAKTLAPNDLLIECDVIIENLGGNEMKVTLKDEHGHDISDLAEAVLRKGDVSTLRGLYTVIKFNMG